MYWPDAEGITTFSSDSDLQLRMSELIEFLGANGTRLNPPNGDIYPPEEQGGWADNPPLWYVNGVINRLSVVAIARPPYNFWGQNPIALYPIYKSDSAPVTVEGIPLAPNNHGYWYWLFEMQSDDEDDNSTDDDKYNDGDEYDDHAGLYTGVKDLLDTIIVPLTATFQFGHILDSNARLEPLIREYSNDLGYKVRCTLRQNGDWFSLIVEPMLPGETEPGVQGGVFAASIYDLFYDGDTFQLPHTNPEMPYRMIGVLR